MASKRRDFYYSISPLFCVSDVLGFTAFSVRELSGSRRPFPLTIYKVAITVLSLFGHIAVISKRSQETDFAFKVGTFLSVSLIVYEHAYNCLMFIGLILFVARNSHYVHLFSIMLGLDVQIHRVAHAGDGIYEKIRKRTIFLIFVHIIWICVNCFPVFAYCDSFPPVLTALFELYAGIVFAVTDMYFVSVMMFLKHMYSTINSVIRNNAQENSRRGTDSNNGHRVRNLMELHYHVNCVCDSFNSVFGVQILLCVFVKFVIAVLDSLIIAQNLINYDKVKSYGWSWYYTPVSEIAWSVSSLLCVTWFCGSVSHEVSDCPFCLK